MAHGAEALKSGVVTGVSRYQRFLFALVFISYAVPVLAGRPLAVDDANVNEALAGHVEMWFARQPAGGGVFNIAPAYSPLAALELAALIARDRAAAATITGAQVKWRVTESDENGCNLGTSAVWSRTRGAAYGTSVNGIVSCNGKAFGTVHLNLGGTQTRGTRNTTWGVALERAIGSVTPSLEWFGTQSQKATVQLGLRADAAKGLQLDGTVNRNAGHNGASVGMKIQF